MKTLFIIGASSGIGKAVAEHSAKQGVSLGLFARPKSVPALSQYAQALSQRHGIGATATALDMTDTPQAILLALQTASQTLGKPDCIWINGGVLLPEQGDDLANEKQIFATNTLGVIACIRAGQALFDGQGGQLAITASTASFCPLPIILRMPPPNPPFIIMPKALKSNYAMKTLA